MAIVNYWFLLNKNKEHYYLVINYFRYKIKYIKLPRYFNDNLEKEYPYYFIYWVSDGQKGIEECCINYLISHKKIFKTYTSSDRYNQTDLYKEIIKLKNEAKAESDLLQKQREDSFKLKDFELQNKKLNSMFLNDKQELLLQTILQENPDLTCLYKAGNVKVLNTIVSKYLSACKISKLNVDPAIVSHILKTKYLV